MDYNCVNCFGGYFWLMSESMVQSEQDVPNCKPLVESWSLFNVKHFVYLTYTSTLPATKSTSRDFRLPGEHSVEISAIWSVCRESCESCVSKVVRWWPELLFDTNTSTRDQPGRIKRLNSTKGLTAIVQWTTCWWSSIGVLSCPTNSAKISYMFIRTRVKNILT